MRVANGYSNERIGTSIIEEPLVLMINETLRKDRSGSILSAFLKICNRTEKGFIESVNES